MNAMTLYFSLFLLMALTLSFVAIWAPRHFWAKVGALFLTVLIVVFSYLSFSDLLSRPKPIGWEWKYKDLKEAVVLQGKIIEGKEIYVLLDSPHFPEPRYYSIPWRDEEDKDGSEGEEGTEGDLKSVPEQLQDALRQQEEEPGSEVIIQAPFQRSWESRGREKKYFLRPPPAPPPKPKPEEPQTFEHPSRL